MILRKVVSTLTMVMGLTMLSVLLHAVLAEAAVPKMTKEELRAKLDDQNVVIVDVRLGKDWKASEEKIKGAIRADAKDVESLTTQYPKDKTLVFYCA